ncbi:MAG TPA: hypothetical protein DIW20_02940 [Rhodospirillaceae bacterium]|nr:hypothetical protein [Rhodospirillaceae bacterium]
MAFARLSPAAGFAVFFAGAGLTAFSAGLAAAFFVAVFTAFFSAFLMAFFTAFFAGFLGGVAMVASSWVKTNVCRQQKTQARFLRLALNHRAKKI